MTEFAGKVVLVTGAGRGLGRALAAAFAARGAIVAANDLIPINLDEIVSGILAAGGRARAYLADVSNKLDLQTMLTAVLEDWARIDVLVNCAGVQPHQPLLDMDEWEWRRTVDVNLTGAFLATQSVARVMRELGGGVILNLGPEEETGGDDPPRAAYLASRHGLLALTRAAARELAPYNVRVNAVCPRPAETDAAVDAALSLCSPTSDVTGKVITAGG